MLSRLVNKYSIKVQKHTVIMVFWVQAVPKSQILTIKPWLNTSKLQKNNNICKKSTTFEVKTKSILWGFEITMKDAFWLESMQVCHTTSALQAPTESKPEREVECFSMNLPMKNC